VTDPQNIELMGGPLDGERWVWDAPGEELLFPMLPSLPALKATEIVYPEPRVVVYQRGEGIREGRMVYSYTGERDW
jgi:hypothetical protein